MGAKQAGVTLALTAALALAGQPAQAQRGHPGGGRPAGGHPGVSRAVPRGGGYGGGVAYGRHPRAGSGGYSYYGHGGHYTPYRYGHYGYYPHGHGSFYFGASLYYGWPYYHASPYYYSGWWPYGWAGYYGPGYYAPYYSYRFDAPDAPPPGDAGRPYASHRACAAVRRGEGDRDAGRVRLEVRPEDASVYVDDDFCGDAREARLLALPAGRHVIELVRPGFGIARREVDVLAGERSDVLVELQRP